MSWVELGLPPTLSETPEAPELPRQFARAFATSDGAAVLTALSNRTLNRQMLATCTDAELRHHEGARSVVWHILNMIERGRS